MAETLATLKTKISSVLQDQPGFIGTGDGEDMEQAVRDALETYARDVPRVLVADVAGDGSTYDLTLPNGYVDGFSRFTAIEYPAGERVPLMLANSNWTIYRNGTTVKLRLLALTPGSGETVRLSYTAQHTIDGLDAASETTVSAHRTWAFVYLAAAKCMLRLADRFLHEQEGTLNADSVDRHSKSDVARRLSDRLMTQYRDLVGVQGGEAPASTIVNWNTSTAGTGVGRLTHRGVRA